jgi:hypothetical protein
MLFFQGCHPKKGFKILNQFAHFNLQFKLLIHYTMHATTFLDFFKPWDLDLRLRVCKTCIINGLFFEFIWKIRTGRFMTNLTLSVILRLNLSLRSYSIWSTIFIAPHIKEDYSGHEHLIASRQPRKYSETLPTRSFIRTRRRLQKYSKDYSTRL